MIETTRPHPFAHFVQTAEGAYVGRHLIVDLWGVLPQHDEQQIKPMFERACRAMGATVLFNHVHPFGPDAGTTGVIVLAESHLTWHHYPECAFVAIDVFVCGPLDPHLALPPIVEFWQPSDHTVREHPRGTLADRDAYLARCRAARRLPAAA